VTKAALKSMLGRKLRTGLTAFAVVLGVAMVAGALIVTDTMRKAADQLTQVSYSGADAAVSTKTAFEGAADSGQVKARGVSDALIERIRALPQVDTAEGEIDGTARLTDKNGKVVATTGGPPFAVGFNAGSDAARSLSPFELRSGAFPAAPGQVAIDAKTAKDQGYKPGDRIGVVSEHGGLKQFRVSGVVSFGGVESIGNATAAVFTLADGQALFGKPGEVDTILIKAKEGVGQAEIEQAVRPVLPPTAQVESAAGQDRFDLGGLKKFIDIIRTALIAFGAVSLFVGAFIIFNTLSITVAQRSREFGLLRMIGASRRQVLRSVLVEAAVIGLIASIVGLGVGFVLAVGLNAVFKSVGLDLPTAGTVFELRTAIVSLVIGVGVTLLAGLSPALRATRVAPVEALREASTTPVRRHGRLSTAFMAITLLGGVALLSYGVFGSGLSVGGRLAILGAGCLILFVGVALVSPRIARPLASVLGRPAERIGGVAGRLARDNAMRNPSRTAVTAAALMIGVALVTFVAVLGAAMSNSFESTLGKELQADFVVLNQDGFSPFGTDAEKALEAPNLSVSAVREDQVQIFGKTDRIAGIDPQTVAQALRFDWKEGSADSLATLGTNGAITTKQYADDHNLSVGSPLSVLTASGDRFKVNVTGVQDRSQFNPLGLPDVLISQELFDRVFPSPKDRYIFAVGDVPQSQLAAALRPFPDVEVFTESAFLDEQVKGFNQFLALLYVLLALSVIVSLFGIVNTLVLSVFERTRELGMLRAIGMTRRQVRRMIRHESIITALIGGVLGMGVGIFMAALVTTALSDVDVTFTLPVGTLVAFLVVAVLAGIVAAVLPARRASRLNVLEALQYE
jgi:putative ABC transport system permease protein